MRSDVHQTRQPADFNRALLCTSDADAFACLLLAADEGCVRAQFLLGLAYHLGRGVAIDYTRAATWYRKAACCADTHAIANLGVMSLLGQGAPADDLDAYTWVQSAVGMGHEWLRPALDLLERRINGRALPADAARILSSVSPETPDLRACTLPGCDPSRCKVV
jgi:TPR repeat protein